MSQSPQPQSDTQAESPAVPKGDDLQQHSGSAAFVESTVLALIREVTQAVNSSLVLEDIFEALGDVLKQYFSYRDATIVILDDTQNSIKLLVRYDEHGNTDLTSDTHDFAGADMLLDQLLKAPNPLRFEGSNLPDSLVLLSGTKDALVVPLMNKGMVTGLMAIASPWEAFFTSLHQAMLQEVSGPVAIAVENAKLYWQTQAQAGRAFLINQITSSIRQSLQIEDVLTTAVNEVGRVTGASRCFIEYNATAQTEQGLYQFFLPTVSKLDPDHLKACPIANLIYDRRKASLSQVELAQLTASRVQEIFNPFVLNHIEDCPPFLEAADFLKDNQIQSFAVFPILIGNELVATMTLHQCNKPRTWLSDDIELMAAITEHLGVALYQARLFGEIDAQKNELTRTLDELKTAQLQLVQSEKMAVIGQFVAGIAHEVNTPLGTIQSNTETLQNCFKKITSGEGNQEKLVETMTQLLSLNHMAGERIQEIVRNLRNFARLDESELKSTDITEGIDSTLLLLNSELKQQQMMVETDYADNLPKVNCYPGLLNQVFMNILVNAIHAMASHESTDTKTIKLTVKPEDNWLVTTIEDNGKGISPENLEKIFDPGFTTKGVGVGTGLGLSLCYKIVEKHHGEISAESELGQGTKFIVKIPLS